MQQFKVLQRPLRAW